MRRLLLLLALGAACSGGGGGGGSQVAGGGIGGTGLSSGGVTGFGSFFVTDTGWTLSPTASVDIDGETSDAGGSFGEDDLLLGMYLRVDGERSEDGSSGTASMVRYDEVVRGAVEQAPIDLTPERKTFSVLGRTIVIDDGLTVFEGTTFATLTMNDVIEVSGPVDASDGTATATRVERLGTLNLGVTQVEFKGAVSIVAGNAFDIGPVRVDFDCGAGTDCSALPGGLPPASGAFVEVEGVQTDAGVTPEVLADVIRPATSFQNSVGNAENVRLEGAIDQFSGFASFTVNGVPVNAASAVRDPTDPSLYGDGAYVQVEGDINGGVLGATRLELKEGVARVFARIASGGLDRVNQNQIVLLAEGTSGQVGFQELVVQVDAATRIEDKSGGDDDLNLTELMVGDYLEVRGIATGGNVLRATEIERESSNDVDLRGPVQSVDSDASDGDRGVTILGIYAEMVQGTTAIDETGNDVGAFLAGLSVGELVKVRDDEDGSEETFDIANDAERE